MAKGSKYYHGKYFLTLIFASIALSSLGIFAQNVFADSVVTTIPLGYKEPNSVNINPNTDKIYVSIPLYSFSNPSCYGQDNIVEVINGTTDSVVGKISVGNDPEGVGINLNTNMIYVANWSSYTVSVINGTTDSVVGTISVASPAGVGVNPNTNMIYVSDSGHGKVDVINGTTNTVVSTIPVGSSYLSYPGTVVVNPNTNKIYVTDDSGLQIIDGTTNTVVKTISSFNIPEGIAINQKTNLVYASDAGYGIYVIDGTNDNIVSTIPVGNSPHGVAVNPNTNKIYVVNYSGDSVTIIDGASNSIVGMISSYSRPNDVAVNPSTNKIYALNSGGQYCPPRTSSITVINGTATVSDSPTGLTATAISPSQINLSWSAPSNEGGSAITGYLIERSSDGGTTWSTIQSNTASTPTTYSDYGLTHSTTYTYRISAINSVGTSQPSNTAAAITLNVVPSPPRGLTATAQLLKINLSWNAPIDNGGTPVTGYMIERSTDDGNSWSTLVANTGNTGTTYSDKNVLPLTTYTYRVSAINDIGTGNPSNTASASITNTPTLP